MGSKRISELQIEVNPQISDLVALASDGQSKRTTLGSILNSDLPTTFGDTTINGDLTVIGTETIVSSSVLYDSGSTIFGDSVDDKHDFIGDVSITGSLFVSGGTELGGDIFPQTPQGATLGTIDKPFRELFLQSGSISIESDTPGDPSAIISNIDGNLDISVGGMRLVEPGNSFIAETGSFSFISGSMTQVGDYIQYGNKIVEGELIVTGSVDITGDYTLNGNSFSSSLFQSSSISGSVIEFTKGDNTTQQVQIPKGLGYSGLGWARYDDTTYTTSSPFSIDEGDTEILPCNGSGSIETHMHSSVPFFNPATQKIQAENDGDVYTVTINMTMRASSNPSEGDHVTIAMSGTGVTPYDRVRRDLFFFKNNTDWHYYHEIFQYYSDVDFVANGNQFNLTASGNNIEVADVIIFIQRTQNHSQH